MSLSLILVYLAAVVLFMILLLSLGFQPRFLTRIAGILLLVAGLSGTLLYGYGYYRLCANLPQAAARTVFSVFCMFLGRNEIGAVSAVPFLAKPGMQIALYLTHLLALYCTASAVVGTIGARLIRTLRLLLSRRGDLSLIYGVSDETLRFARELPGRTKAVFIDTGSGAAAEQEILHMGGLLFQDEAAKSAGKELLRRIGMRAGKRRLTVYALDADPSANLRFAQALLQTLEECEIRPRQTALTLILPDESVSGALQAADGRYGYGSVLAYERETLLGRQMIRAFPPCGTMRFDGSGRAEEDFEALIVGFGKTGQAVLRALVMNGQFAGSRFHATVVAKDYTAQAGSFFSRFPALREQYDVTFIDADAKSVELYEQIERTKAALNYVAVCAGDAKETAEIAVELTALFAQLDVRALIVQCGAAGLRKNADRRGPAETIPLLTAEILCSERMDERAMRLNCRYHGAPESSAAALWAECGYFSRMSCRASADFTDALLRSAGADRQAAAAADFALPEATLENLAQTEHLRWCAFHCAMGYRPMPDEIWQERAELYREKRKENETPPQIGKDPERRLHACLIDWDALDALSRRENEVTGGCVDYKEYDRENVRTLLSLLQQEGGTDA